MLYFYFLSLDEGADAALKELKRKKAAALLLRPEIAAMKKFITYTHYAAYKSFHSRSCGAKLFETEWLSRVACTRNYGKAGKFCLPGKKAAAIVSETALSDKELSKIGGQTNFKPTKKDFARLASEYGLEAPPGFSLEDLLIEKSAVLFAGA